MKKGRENYNNTRLKLYESIYLRMDAKLTDIKLIITSLSIDNLTKCVEFLEKYYTTYNKCSITRLNAFIMCHCKYNTVGLQSSQRIVKFKNDD